MDIDKIKAFLVLAKTGNFGKASEELYISQSALSKQIQGLENDLQVPLFNRTKKATYLTVYGEYFQNYARNILANYSNAKEAIRQVVNLEQGILSFGATNFIGVYLIPSILAQFRQMYPGITLNMSINSSKNILAMLDACELEFILLSDYVQVDEERFVRQTWCRDELKVIVGRGSRFFQQDTLRLEDLKQETFITKKKSASLYKFIRKKFAGTCLPLEHPLVISQQEAIKQAVINNLGVSIMSPAAVKLEEKFGLIKSLTIEDHPLERRIEIVHEKSWHLTPAAKEFFKLLLPCYQR